ncbi:MAG: hypothetical protein SOZ59_09870 [Candidatus Limivivens sp.]|nr:hypothetical protein [Candidatus Limivivens sp.]
MLQFIMETNTLFYAMAAVCILGVLSQIFLGRVYVRLAKDTARGGQAQGKLMKRIRQRISTSRNHAILIENSLMEYQILGRSLHSWQRTGFQAMALVLLFGIAGWYLAGTREMGTAVQQSYLLGIGGAAVITLLAYLLADNGYKKRNLETCLLDYLENTLGEDACRTAEAAAALEPAKMPASRGEAEKAQPVSLKPAPRERHLKLKETKAQRDKRELKENLSRIKEGLSESAASQEKERNTEILKQMDPKEQERVIREVLKEFLS